MSYFWNLGLTALNFALYAEWDFAWSLGAGILTGGLALRDLGHEVAARHVRAQMETRP